MTYFDAIVDETFTPVFNSTRDACLTFLKELARNGLSTNHLTCVPGETLEQLDVDTYMNRYAEGSR